MEVHRIILGRSASAQHHHAPILPQRGTTNRLTGDPSAGVAPTAFSSQTRLENAKNMRVIKTNKSVAGLAGPTWHLPLSIPHRRASASGLILISDAPGPLNHRVTSAPPCACFINTNTFYAGDYLPHPRSATKRSMSPTSNPSPPPIAQKLSVPTPVSVRAALRCPRGAGDSAARNLTGGPPGDTPADSVYLLPLCGSVDAAHSPKPGPTGRLLQGTPFMQLARSSLSTASRCINKVSRRIMS